MLNSINSQVRKSDFISHIKASNMYSLFESTDEGSSTRWQNVAITAFKYELPFIDVSSYILFIIYFRLFDQNYDGYIDKKEFKWMTTSAKVSNKTIDIVFSVSSREQSITGCLDMDFLNT